jgi:hypothetical protein
MFHEYDKNGGILKSLLLGKTGIEFIAAPEWIANTPEYQLGLQGGQIVNSDNIVAATPRKQETPKKTLEIPAKPAV